MFNDIFPRNNCIREETVRMTKRIIIYKKCCNRYDCIRVRGLGGYLWGKTESCHSKSGRRHVQ